MAVVIVGLRDDEAMAAHRGDAAAASDVSALLRSAGAALQPLHPGTTDPELRAWFYADVDEANAARVVAACLELPVVTAAYVKPEESPP